MSMDLPNFLHHQNLHSHSHSHNQVRYVSVPNSSRPHYPDDPNSQIPRYHRHHHDVLQPPPPPPPPQTPPFQPLPPPQPSPFHPPPTVHGHTYNPGQSQFAFANPSHGRSFEDDHHPRSSYALREFAPSHTVSHRLPVVDDDRPRHRLPEFDPDSRQEFWEKSRVLAENLPERMHLPLEFDSGSQKFQFDHKPMSPYKTGNRVRHDFETSSRFRVEYADAYESKHRDEVLRGHEDEKYGRGGNFLPSSGMSFHDVGFVSNSGLSVKNLESESENYHDNRYGSVYDKELFRGGRGDVGYENQRRVHHDRKVPRDAHKSSFERGGGEVSNGDGAYFVSHKREYYGSESGRYNSRGSREDGHEFTRTLRKQTQKKSALLRLQKQNHRNTESEQSQYSGYHDNSSCSYFRRRDHYVKMANGVDEGEEGAPVELDVSFKDNSLVAKPILALVSSSEVNDTDLTPRNMKGGKDSVADRDCSNAELTKLSDNTINEDSSMHLANIASTFEKKVIQSEGKAKDMCDASSHACLGETNHSLEKKEVQRSPKGADLDKVGTKVGPNKPPLKVVKKKKVVKKTVKKVVHPHSQQKKKHDESVKADPLILTPSEASEIGKVAVPLSYPCPNETNTLHAGRKVEGSPVAIELEKHGIDESQTKCETQIEKNGNNFDTCLGSSSLEEIKIDQNSENIEYSAQGIQAMSNNDEVLVKSFENTLLDIANAVDAEQSCRSGDSLLLDNELEKDSSPITLPVRDKVDSAFLNLKSIKRHDNCTSMYCSAKSIDAILDIVHGTKVLKEENPVQGEISKATTARSSATVGLSSPGEKTMDAYTSDHDPDRVTSSGHNNESICEENITLSRSGTVDCNTKQPTTDGSSGLPENSTIGSPRNTKSSVGDIEGATPLIRKKRNIRSQLDVSRTTNIDLDPVNISNPAIAMNTKLSLSFEDPSCEVAAVSSMGSLDDGLQPGKNWARGSSDGFPEANLIGKDGADGFRVTPRRRKRRKASASRLAMSYLTTLQTDEQPVADTSTFCMVAPLSPNDVLAQQNMELYTSAKDPVCAATDLMNSENEITVLHENKLLKGCSDAVGVVSFVNDERQKDDGVVMAVDDNQIEVLNVKSRREEEVGVPASNGQVIAQHETPECTTSSGILPPDAGKSSPFTDMQSDNLLVKDDFSNLPNYSSSPNDCSGAISIDEAMDSVPDSLTITSSLQTSFDLSDVHMSDVTSGSEISKQICREDEKLDQKSLEEKGSEVCAQKSISHHTKSNLTLDSATESDQTIEGKTAASPLQDSRSMSHSLSITSVESNGQKNQLGLAVSRTFPGRSSFGTATLKKSATSTHANQRTWHRNANSSACPLPQDKTFSKIAPSQKQLPERNGKVQSTSYVRKGNSLVRKPSPTAAFSQGPPVYRLNSAGSDESKRSIESDNRVGVGNTLGSSGVAETKVSFDDPRSLPTQSVDKQPNYVAISSGDCTSSPSAGPLFNGSCETNSDPISSSENNETTKLVEDSPTSEAFENRNFQLNSLDNQTEISNGNLASLNMKQIVYVKRKSNQLVATSSSIDCSVANADNIQTSSFDGCYKRKKNQLIRTSLESTKRLVVPDDNFKSGVQMTLCALPSRRSSKRRSDKVVPKTFKRSTNPLVWTLCSTQSTKVNSGSLYHQKFLPHLFPWKRTTYWRSFMQNANLIYKGSSLAISKKLLLSRTRDTVYTRSINGFSLRKSKVLSVGGASLKWSKSIESRSKKANEEATLAVVAVEKKKKEQKGAPCISSGLKNRNYSSRERIFRIGSSRYKMDPSRRTLQRIPDDESSCTTSTHPDKDAKRSYVPRRLLIGNDEYVRIGNGNQLIRNPKKRTRILASEKVRWSLHTARLRLAKKRKYCQFFTRFGKCNKDTGKCPYIHDPSKIAVCTKFLNGLCSDANCKLTHKVIPERMPDCSYFLQGLCTNQNCPYRHVNVNPKASTCEGFLRGYCADGNECRKKHSYVCPTFEATGTCPQGLKCKLHHPKSRIHGKEKKRSRELKNARGRYFGSPDISTSDSRITVSEKHFVQDSNGISSEGKCADFIGIDVSNDECNDSRNEQITFCDSDTSDLESEDLDALIKPLRIMDTSLTA